MCIVNFDLLNSKCNLLFFAMCAKHGVLLLVYNICIYKYYICKTHFPVICVKGKRHLKG